MMTMMMGRRPGRGMASGSDETQTPQASRRFRLTKLDGAAATDDKDNETAL